MPNFQFDKQRKSKLN